jgi:hypothetical protein
VQSLVVVKLNARFNAEMQNSDSNVIDTSQLKTELKTPSFFIHSEAFSKKNQVFTKFSLHMSHNCIIILTEAFSGVSVSGG